MEAGDGSGRPLAAMLAASLALHVAVVLATRVASSHVARAESALAEPVDTWAGSTSLPGELVDIGVDEGAHATASPTHAPPVPPAEPAVDPSPAAPAAAPASPVAPAPKTTPPARDATPAAPPVAAPSEAHAPAIARNARPQPRRKHHDKAASEAHPPSPQHDARSPKHADDAPTNRADAPVARSAASGTPGEAGSFGAEGTAAKRDIGHAFTRALPAACVADRGWAELPPGDAGRLTIRVMLDDAGKITGWEPEGSAPPPPRLVATVKRTLAMLEAGTFALAKGDVGAGVAVLELRARVEDRTPEDDGSGGALRLEQRWSGDHGTAAFTQPSGRHVEITIRRVP